MIEGIQTYAASKVDYIHVLLAYGAMIIHIFLKTAALQDNKPFSVKILKTYIIHNLYTILATLIMIPVLLTIATDPSIKTILPLNYVTAALAGWQTNSTFIGVMEIYSHRLKKPTNENDI